MIAMLNKSIKSRKSPMMFIVKHYNKLSITLNDT